MSVLGHTGPGSNGPSWDIYVHMLLCVSVRGGTHDPAIITQAETQGRFVTAFIVSSDPLAWAETHNVWWKAYLVILQKQTI